MSDNCLVFCLWTELSKNSVFKGCVAMKIFLGIKINSSVCIISSLGECNRIEQHLLKESCF